MNDLRSTLILDRDGVINRRLPDDYINDFNDFEFLQGAKKAIGFFRKRFDYLFIVTNQQGIGKGLMSREDLDRVHERMISELQAYDVTIDGIYYCPELAEEENNCRKPNLHMAQWIKRDFPDVNFKHAVIMGDSAADLIFGKRLNMTTVWIRSEPDRKQAIEENWYDFQFNSLSEAAGKIEEIELEMWT